jgi:hypothetical protein
MLDSGRGPDEAEGPVGARRVGPSRSVAEVQGRDSQARRSSLITVVHRRALQTDESPTDRDSGPARRFARAHDSPRSQSPPFAGAPRDSCSPDTFLFFFFFSSRSRARPADPATPRPSPGADVSAFAIHDSESRALIYKSRQVFATGTWRPFTTRGIKGGCERRGEERESPPLPPGNDFLD